MKQDNKGTANANQEATITVVGRRKARLSDREETLRRGEWIVGPDRDLYSFEQFAVSRVKPGRFISFLDKLGETSRPYLERALNRRPNRVRQPPGAHLNFLAQFIWGKKTYQHVFQPIIVDLQDEYAQSLAEGRTWHAQWVWLRGHLSFWLAVAAMLPVSIVRLAFRLWTTVG